MWEHDGWVWIFWLVSQTWICRHLWKPRSEPLAKTDVLFVQPMYDGLLIEHSLALNRRKYDDKVELDTNKKDDDANIEVTLNLFYFLVHENTISKHVGFD